MVRLPAPDVDLAKVLRALLVAVLIAPFAEAHEIGHDKFRQLEEILPTPNDFRTASGAPGRAYWQQRADYEMDLELDDVQAGGCAAGKKRGSTYQQPFTRYRLHYLWLQLDQNLLCAATRPPVTSRKKRLHFKEAAAKNKMPLLKEFHYKTLNRLLYLQRFRGRRYGSSRVADASRANDFAAHAWSKP